METANQKCNESTVDDKLCKGPNGAFYATSAAPGRDENCKTARASECPCSGLDRLEAALGIQGSVPNKMFASQVAEDITPAEAAAMIEANKEGGGLAILDVSTGREYREWHVKKAININMFSLKFSEKLNGLDKETTYLVYCKMGGRSAAAQKVMLKHGFRKVFNIVGGRDRWRAENLPYGSGPAKYAAVRTCPVSMTLRAFARLNANLKQLLSSIRSTGEAGSH